MKKIKILLTAIVVGLLSFMPIMAQENTTLTAETAAIENEGGSIIFTTYAMYNGFVVDGVYPKEYTLLRSWIIEYVTDTAKYVKIIAYDHNGDVTAKNLGKMTATTLKVVGVRSESTLEYSYKCIDLSDNTECFFGASADGFLYYIFKKGDRIRIFKAELRHMKIAKDKKNK